MELESFVHLELLGPIDEVRAFVEGFRLAFGEQRVYLTAKENIKTDGFLGGLVSRVTHFVVPSGFVGPLGEAIEAATLVNISVLKVSPIDHAEMKFDFRCYSREDGDAIRSVIETDLPEGVVLDGYQPEATIDSGAKGSELYSPVHEVVVTGRGQYHGPVEGIIAMGRRLDDQDFIHPERIHLVQAG